MLAIIAGPPRSENILIFWQQISLHRTEATSSTHDRLFIIFGGGIFAQTPVLSAGLAHKIAATPSAR